MNEQWLLPEEQRRRDLSAWFTPPWLADRMALWLALHHGEPRTLLEPSAGNGALARALLRHFPTARLDAWEVDPAHTAALRALERTTVHQADFLAADFSGRPLWDAALFNTPYEDNQDVDFALKILEHAAVAVGLFRGVFRHGQERWVRFWRHVDILREVVLVDRPCFGERRAPNGKSQSPKQDFVILDLRLRSRPRSMGEPSPPYTTEWW